MVLSAVDVRSEARCAAVRGFSVNYMLSLVLPASPGTAIDGMVQLLSAFRSRIPTALLVGLIAGCALSSPKADDVSNGRKLSAEEIIVRMAQTYASARTYRDTGQAETITLIAGIVINRSTAKRPFTTAFVRPDRFRFEYRLKRPSRNEWKRYIVHADSTGVRTWWSIRPGVEQEKSLSLAIVGARGVSRGSAHTVPVLLMPEAVRGWSMTELKNPSKFEDGVIDGREYWRVRGKGPNGDTIILWIDPETYLIRRIQKRSEYSTIWHFDPTTDYNSKIDVEIHPDELKFDPGEKK